MPEGGVADLFTEPNRCGVQCDRRSFPPVTGKEVKPLTEATPVSLSGRCLFLLAQGPWSFSFSLSSATAEREKQQQLPHCLPTPHPPASPASAFPCSLHLALRGPLLLSSRLTSCTHTPHLVLSGCLGCFRVLPGSLPHPSSPPPRPPPCTCHREAGPWEII